MKTPTLTKLKNALSTLDIDVSRMENKSDAINRLFCVSQCWAYLSKEDSIKNLVKRLKASDSQVLCMFADAILHQKFGIKPKDTKLGYTISSLPNHKHFNFNDKQKELYEQSMDVINIEEYVFSTTHYDECSNGFYYRRS